jgi:hypothetical protein
MPLCNLPRSPPANNSSIRLISPRNGQIDETRRNRLKPHGQGHLPKSQFLLANSNYYKLQVASLSEPILACDRRVAPLAGAPSSIAPRLMIAAESSNAQQICQRLRGPSPNKFWSAGRHAAQIKLMGHGQILRGHVDSIARAISVSNAQPNNQGVATVNPIFTWVRLAQRIPVRIHIDEVPPDIILSAGMTATVEIEEGAPVGRTESANAAAR